MGQGQLLNDRHMLPFTRQEGTALKVRKGHTSFQLSLEWGRGRLLGRERVGSSPPAVGGRVQKLRVGKALPCRE